MSQGPPPGQGQGYGQPPPGGRGMARQVHASGQAPKPVGGPPPPSLKPTMAGAPPGSMAPSGRGAPMPQYSNMGSQMPPQMSSQYSHSSSSKMHLQGSGGSSQGPMHPNTRNMSQSQVQHSNEVMQRKILTSAKLKELLQSISPTETMENEVEQLLIEMAEDFVDNAMEHASTLALHRKSQTVDVSDIKLHLEHNWNIIVPSFDQEDYSSKLRPRPPVSEAHAQRITAVRKTQALNATAQSSAQPQAPGSPMRD